MADQVEQAAAAPAARPNQANPRQQGLNIPALNQPFNQLAFGRLDSDYHVVDLVGQIENQDEMAAATFNAIQSVLSIDMTLTQAQFTRMWKTILLKRYQDIFEAEKFQRHANFVRLGRQVPLPAPLADLCHTLGYYHSAADGHMYHLNPPAQPAQPEPWRAVEAQLLALYVREMQRVSVEYTMKEFPAPNQCADRPLLLTTRNEVNDFVIIKAWTNEPKPVDAYIRAVNPDLIQAHAYITHANASLTMTQQLDITTVRAQYAGSYIIDSNA